MLVGVFSGKARLVINIHDTYYVIAYMHIAILISILFGIIGLGYWAMQKANKRLSKWLNRIHLGLTFGGAIIVLILTQFYRSNIREFEFNHNLSLTITMVLMIIVLSQVLFLINVIHGLLKK